MTAALGVCITFRLRLFNFGGEGQIYAGGLVSSALILACARSGGALNNALVLLLAFAASLVTGAVLGAASGLLKNRAGASELLSTFLLSAALIPLCDALVGGPLRDKSGSLLASAPFAAALPRVLPPSNLSISVFAAPLLIAAFSFYLTRTAAGYRFAVAGDAPLFARFGGIRPRLYTTPALALGAALHGGAGFFLCAGSAGRLHSGFSGGAGWNAIAIALLAGRQPLVIIPVALVFCAIMAVANNALLLYGLPLETKRFIEAAFLLLAAVLRSVKLKKGR
jgi:simple sugar transport system permease protein